MGLGLAIVQRTAALLGASIRVNSVPGRGSLFSIRLPAMQNIQPPHLRMGERHGEPVSSGRQKVILVIDDDRDVLASMQTLLRAWGHTVVAAQSMEQAVAAARSHCFVLEMVVTDFRLARHVTGVEVIHAVFQSIGRVIPAIIITGDTSTEGINAASSSGFRVMHKPLDPQELQALIEAQPA